MGYNSFRSSSPSSKGNAGRHRLKFLVIVCMTMVFVLSISTFLAPFSNLMRISACNIGPDGGVLARESDQFSAYTLQHQVFPFFEHFILTFERLFRGSSLLRKLR